MKRALTIVLALVFAISFTACEKAPYLRVLGDSWELTNAEQTIEIIVESNIPYSITIGVSCQDWIKQSESNSPSSDRKVFFISQNSSYDDRNGTILFKSDDGALSQTVTVHQNQVDGIFTTVSEYDLSGNAQKLDIEVTSNVDLEVIAQADWITYVGTKSLKSSTITLDIATNNSGASRIGTVVISNKGGGVSSAVKVSQAVAPPEGAIDLGLPSGIFWASCNIGASKPEEYGDFYAWGEIETKDSYSWENYKWCAGTHSSLTKYNSVSNFGKVDQKTELDLEDDVAHVKLGGKWRMPTRQEILELQENCTIEWTTQNGVNGYTVTGAKYGHSIFIPASGFRGQTGWGEKGEAGYYWSRTAVGRTSPPHAYCISFRGKRIGYDEYNTRCTGYPIRAVTE